MASDPTAEPPSTPNQNGNGSNNRRSSSNKGLESETPSSVIPTPVPIAPTPKEDNTNGRVNGKTNGNRRAKNDIDVLLANSHCDKFVLRCMENELPPNLIHCMRLLRVLE
jgi:hypothetical protein